MKKVPVLSKMVQLGAAALIAVAPVAASAQTVAGRVVTPGVSAGMVPAIGASLGAPLMSGSLARPRSR